MIIFVQLWENRKLKYALNCHVIGCANIGCANNDLNDKSFCPIKKVCYLGHYSGCLFINQWNSEKC